MPIYDKPVRLLMKDMISDMGIEKGDVLTRETINRWFTSKYPKIKAGTISAHLIRSSTNARSRKHYNARPVEDDVFYQIDGSRFRLYDPENDPAPLTEMRGQETESLEDLGESPSGDSAFAYEEDLRDYLAKNLEIIEPGLKLYEEEDVTGIEFPAGGRFIDILAIDKNNDYVVIELKVSRGYDRVIGQLLRYMGWIQHNQIEEGQNVRGVIVAREISKDLILACSNVPNIELFEYHLSISLEKV